MKRCPQCNRVETDEALKFCRVDGATLVTDSSAIGSESGTAVLGSANTSEVHTSILPHNTSAGINRATGTDNSASRATGRKHNERASQRKPSQDRNRDCSRSRNDRGDLRLSRQFLSLKKREQRQYSIDCGASF